MREYASPAPEYSELAAQTTYPEVLPLGRSAMASSPPMSLPLKPPRSPWLWMVKVTALLSLVAPAILVFIGTIDLFPFGLLPAAAFVWYCKWLLSTLDRKKGLTGAVGAGMATICVNVALLQLFTPGQYEMSWPERVIILLLFLLPATLIASAIKTYCGMGPARGDVRVWMAGLGLGAVYFFIVFISFLQALSTQIPPRR